MRTLAGFSLCFLVLMYLGRLPEVVPFLAPLHFGKLTVLIGLIVVLATAPRDLMAFIKNTPFSRWMLLLFAIAIIGFPLSVWPGDALDKNISFLRVLLIISIIIGLAVQSGVQALRFSCVTTVAISALLMVLEKSSGRLSVGASYDPNDIALLLIVFLPVVVAEALQGNRALRPFYWGIAGMALIGIALTGSRGGILALSAVGLHVLIAAKKRIWIVLPLLAVGGWLILGMADASLWERFQALGDNSDYNLTDKHGRLAIWSQGLGFILHNPLLGVGIGQFGSASYMHGLGSGLTAHNSFIQIGAELGLPGLVAFIGMLVTIRRVSKRGSANSFFTKAERLRYSVLNFSLTGFCVGAFFLSQAYGGIFITLVALASAMYIQLREAEEYELSLENEWKIDENIQEYSHGEMENAFVSSRMTKAERERLLAQGDAYAKRRKEQYAEEERRT